MHPTTIVAAATIGFICVHRVRRSELSLKMRFLGHAGDLVASVAAVLVRDERVLLCHRRPDRRWFPDVWDLPGGHVEASELPTAALLRELAEELGITADPVDRPPVFEGMVGDDTHLTVWVVERWAGDVVNLAPEEHDRIGWYDAADLAALGPSELADAVIGELCRQALIGR